MGLLRVTPRAKEELFALAARPENRDKGVRVFIEGMPHAEKNCWILFDGESRAVDRICVEDGLTFIVGPESAWYVKGKELDYEDTDRSFYLTPIPGCTCGYDHEEWAYLDGLPPEEEPWDDDAWELIEDDTADPEEPKRPAARPAAAGDRLPRGWRPAP